jgi:predicted nucleic acid-binding protein
MTPIFADTSYWIALLNPRDELHAKAVSVSEKFSSARIVTSEMVLVELLNSFSDAGPKSREAATAIAEGLRSHRRVKVVAQTAEQFEDDLQRYNRETNKSWSITDCASFRIMEQERAQAAFTHDRHFAQAGYEALLR